MAAVAYMGASGEGIDPPYGALVDLVRDLTGGKASEFDAATQIRAWRV
jgi:hypothetical protein